MLIFRATFREKDKKTVIDRYQQALKKLRDDFLSEVIVTVDTNVFRIIAEVESITDGIKDLGLCGLS